MGRTKPKKPRNYHAVNAQFRNSAGAIRSKKRELNKYKCRDRIEIECECDEEECDCQFNQE